MSQAHFRLNLLYSSALAIQPAQAPKPPTRHTHACQYDTANSRLNFLCLQLTHAVSRAQRKLMPRIILLNELNQGA
jgi:hypothetical protein